MTTKNKTHFLNNQFKKLKDESVKIYDKRLKTAYKRKNDI